MKSIGNNKGFTLLELAIAMAAMALFTTAAIPYFIRQAETSAAMKAVKEISSLQEAAKWYYLSNLAWPSSLQALKSSGLLSPQWSGRNPWGSVYSVFSNGTTLTVVTTVPSNSAGAVTRALPGAALFGSGSSRTVASAISAPGYEAGLDEVTNTAVAALDMANESAVPPYGPYTGLGGRGWIPPCPPNHVVVGTHAGGGKNAAGVHCQRVKRSGSSSNDAISALQGTIAQLEADYAQLLRVNRNLQVRYQRLVQEYREFREWWSDQDDDD